MVTADPFSRGRKFCVWPCVQSLTRDNGVGRRRLEHKKQPPGKMCFEQLLHHQCLCLNTCARPSGLHGGLSRALCWPSRGWDIRQYLKTFERSFFLDIVHPLQVIINCLVYGNIMNFFSYLYLLPRSWGRLINWLKWKSHLCCREKPLKTWVREEEIPYCLLTR